MRHLRLLLLSAAAMAGAATAVEAQPQPRVLLLVNGGFQASSTTFRDSFTFTANQETGTSDVSYPVAAAPVFEGGAAIRLWKGLAIGGVVTRFSGDNTVDATSRVPHPLFFEQHREVSGEAPGVRREETAVHIQAQYRFPVGRLHLVLAGGPSVFHVRQDIVHEVKYTEQYPYDVAEFAGITSGRVSARKNGFNVGVDAQWMFTRHVGAGGLVRLARADVDLAVDGRTISLEAGGTQVAAGLRLAF